MKGMFIPKPPSLPSGIMAPLGYLLIQRGLLLAGLSQPP